MYSFTFIQALQHAEGKGFLKSKDCYEFGKPQLNMDLLGYFKSYFPNLPPVRDCEDLWKELGCKSYNNESTNTDKRKKYDLIVSTNSFDDLGDPFSHLQDMWSQLKVDGAIILDLPASQSSCTVSFGVNFIYMLRRFNNIDIPYCKLSDKTGQFGVSPDVSNYYTTSKINDQLLFKFKDTKQLRLTVTLKRKEGKELRFND